jgi:hypothetical protein
MHYNMLLKSIDHIIENKIIRVHFAGIFVYAPSF